MDHILIADDDADIRAVTRSILEDEGYTCAEAADGNTALRLLKTAPAPWIVLLDLGLPYLNTTALLKLLIYRRTHMPPHAYVLFSAQSSQMHAALLPLTAQLAMSTLRKPFAIDDLLTAVAQAAARLPIAAPVPMLLHTH